MKDNTVFIKPKKRVLSVPIMSGDKTCVLLDKKCPFLDTGPRCAIFGFLDSAKGHVKRHSQCVKAELED